MAEEMNLGWLFLTRKSCVDFFLCPFNVVANRICSLLWVVRPNCVAFMHFKDENLDRNNYVSDSSRTFEINFVHYECETNDDRNLSSLDCVELWGHLCFRLREYWLFFLCVVVGDGRV